MNYRKVCLSIICFTLPLLLSAQVSVNEEHNVGIKTDNIASDVSLKITNAGNRINLHSDYNFTSTSEFGINAYLKSIITSDVEFKGIYNDAINRGSSTVYGIYNETISEVVAR